MAIILAKYDILSPFWPLASMPAVDLLQYAVRATKYRWFSGLREEELTVLRRFSWKPQRPYLGGEQRGSERKPDQRLVFSIANIKLPPKTLGPLRRI
jgi:hypothetical protein